MLTIEINYNDDTITIDDSVAKDRVEYNKVKNLRFIESLLEEVMNRIVPTRIHPSKVHPGDDYTDSIDVSLTAVDEDHRKSVGEW